MTVTFLKMSTDKWTQKYRATSPAPLPQDWFNSPAWHWLNYVSITDRKSPTEGATPRHISPQRPPTQAVPERETMIRVSRAVCVHFCVAVCCLSLFHMEGEEIRHGDNEMNGTAATFMNDLGNNFSQHWVNNRAGAIMECLSRIQHRIHGIWRKNTDRSWIQKLTFWFD